MTGSAVSVTHVVATAGHADHGKSALISALTADPKERAGAERGRAVTTAAGSGWLRLPSGTRVAFTDVPGRERFVSTMMAGTGPVPAVLFVVAADEGWVPQSAEQLALVSTLDIRHGLLAVTKSDLADPAPVLAEAAARIASSTLGDVPAVAVSSATRAGIPELVEALDQLCSRLPAPDPGAPVRIWIDRTLSGSSGTPSSAVVTGTLAAGTVHRDDELLVTPAMRLVRVVDLYTLGARADTVTGAAMIALHLRGVGPEALHRGMALAQTGRWTLTDMIDVRIGTANSPADERTWLSGQGAAGTGQLARSVALYLGSAKVTARVRALGSGIARLTLADPLPLHVGDRVLLRDPVGRRSGSWPAAASAVVLDVAPPSLTRRGAAAAAARQLAAWPDRPSAAEVLARHGLLRASTLLAMGISELPSPVTGEWLADPEHWGTLGRKLGEAVASHAAAEPLAQGLPVEAARAALELPDRRLVVALAQRPFQISCGAVHIVAADVEDGGTTTLPDTLLAAVRVLRADLDAAPFASPDMERLRKLGLDAGGIAAAVAAGELMRISDHIVLAPGADVAAARILARLEQPFTAAQARLALATTRRTVIPLLEYLDSRGVTERLADDRRVIRTAERNQPS
ncbi:MAG: SelB C-terminal domain-containing protein [Actinobacteria bacterium]|nr:SelB C-terminal domain-containing protein [Actinomycetota bacterium]